MCSLNRGGVLKERFHFKVLSNDPEKKTPKIMIADE